MPEDKKKEQLRLGNRADGASSGVLDELVKSVERDVKEKVAAKKMEQRNVQSELMASMQSGTPREREQEMASPQLWAQGGQNNAHSPAAGKDLLSRITPAQRAALRQKEQQSARLGNRGKAAMAVAEQRTEAQSAAGSKNAESEGEKSAERSRIANMRMQANAKAQMAKARAQAFKARLKSKMMERDKAELDAFSIAVIMMAFTLAVGADILEVVLTALASGMLSTVLLSPFAGVAEIFSSSVGFAASAAVGFLWWSVGAGDFSGRARKFGKRTILTMFGETLVSFMPWLTIECILNFLDLIGVFDMNDTTKEIKSIIS